MPDSVTQILASGPPGAKQNIAVLGDGFAAGDQTAYNNKVQELLIDGVFGHDYFYEDTSAYNIFRVNLISAQSGVSTRVYNEHGTPTDPSDDTITSTTIRNTALGYIFSGSWAHCWLEGGAGTSTKVQNALNTWVPDYDLVVIILNNPGFGGCGGGGFQIVTLGSSWTVMAHEFGHGTGGLADEYCAKPGTYTGGEPGSPNLTINTNRATLKWRQFVSPATPVPTGTGLVRRLQPAAAKPAGWSDIRRRRPLRGRRHVVDAGIYRPAINCRMRGNSPPYCPVCYTRMKSNAEPFAQHTFQNVLRRRLQRRRQGRHPRPLRERDPASTARTARQLDLVFSAVERVPGSWQFKPGDKFYVGDFNGDGKDEVVVFNGTDWAIEYLGLLADDGANGLKLIARYDNSMPGWDFTPERPVLRRRLQRRREEGPVSSTTASNWAIPYVGMLRSSGTGFSLVAALRRRHSPAGR